jgi:hypothetical protein
MIVIVGEEAHIKVPLVLGRVVVAGCEEYGAAGPAGQLQGRGKVAHMQAALIEAAPPGRGVHYDGGRLPSVNYSFRKATTVLKKCAQKLTYHSDFLSSSELHTVLYIISHQPNVTSYTFF